MCPSSKNYTGGAVDKGALVAEVRAPFDLLGRHRVAILVTLGVVVCIAAVQIARGAIASLLPLANLLIVALFVLANRVAFLLCPVRVYELGIEFTIPRSWNKSAYLAWEQIQHYELDEHVLRYTWRPNGVVVLRNGDEPGRWPILYFPRALRIPDADTRTRLRVILSTVIP
jgi:hypothetical protein